MTGSVELVVREATAQDAGRGIVRVPEGARRELGVLSGDTVLIEGDQRTAATVWPAGGDLEAGTARVDGETRRNAGARVGDTVAVRPENVVDGERIVVAPEAALSADPDAVGGDVKRALLGRPVAAGERLRVEAMGSAREFRVVETEPEGTVVVNEDTTVAVPTREASSADDDGPVGTTYEDIGGLGEELEQVRELVELPLSEPELFGRLGIDPPKGVLLYGPPGTGKTLIAKAVANEADAHFINVSGPEIMQKYKGESEQRLREVFEEAGEEAPAIVFFDEIDSIAGEREGDAGAESRVVGQMLSLMDGLEARGEVVVIGATNRVDTIDPALRRPGRFDREIEIGVPDRDGREEILQIHTRGMPLGEGVDLDRVADQTHGFVGADLRALATEAAMYALRRCRRDEGDPSEVAVTRDDVGRSLAGVEPSAMREFVAELPETGFDDIGGLDEQKRSLREAVEWPLTHPELFEQTATDPPTGILLYGPPGTGKTMLSRAVANEAGVNFVRVAGPELLDRYVGESEKAVREVFDRARQAAPVVVCFDEIDAVAGRRGGESDVGERVVSQLLTELDGAAGNPNLVVVGATNRRDALDPALLRPGRLEEHLEVPPPDEAARGEILRVHTQEKPLGEDVDIGRLAARLEGYTGADLRALVRRASMAAIRASADRHGTATAGERADEIRVRSEHFEAAIEATELPPRQ